MGMNRGKYGQYEGNLLIKWIPRRNPPKTFLAKCWSWFKPREFIFIKDDTHPFSFTDSNGLKITPESMYSDLGSVPRLLWVLLSLIDFLPAYIIHDYEFESHKLGLSDYTFEGSCTRIAEGIRTIQFDDGAYSNEVLVFVVYWAVKIFGKSLWNKKNKVDIPGA